MDIIQLLSVAYSGDKAARTEATARLEEALQSSDGPQHLITLLRAGTNPSLPPGQSLSALLYAKNSLMYTMPEKLREASSSALEEIKSLLYAGVFCVPPTHQSVILTGISTIISEFDWNYLPQLMPEIARDKVDVPVETSLASLRLLYLYVKRFKLFDMVPTAMKMEVCSGLIDALPSFFPYVDLRVDHMVFKVMECVVEVALSVPSARNLPLDALGIWFDGMAQHPERHFAVAREAAAAGGSQKVYDAYLRCLKRIAVISYSVLRSALLKKKKPLAKRFLSGHAAVFFGVWQRWLEHSAPQVEWRVEHRKVDIFALRYMQLCARDPSLYQHHLHPNLMGLIESLFFPFLCYGGKEDEEAFADESDIDSFAQYMLDESFDQCELTQRQAASNAILAMVSTKKKHHDPLMRQKLIETLAAGLSRPDDPSTFAQTFGFLHLLSVLRNCFRSMSEIWQGQISQVLIAYVIPRTLPTVPFTPLRSKAILVCDRYSKAPFPSEEQFASFIQLICALLSDADPRIRLGSIDAICSLLEMKRARPYLRPVLSLLVDECIAFFERVRSSFLPTVLMYLAEHFAPELTTVLGKLGSALVQHFLAAAFDMFLLEEKQDSIRSMGEDDCSRFDRAAHTAITVLDAINAVVVSSSNNIPAFLAMRPDLIRLTRSVLETPDGVEFLDNTLLIYVHVVSFSKPIPPECWELLPLIFQSVASGEGVDSFSTIEEVLDNYISNGTVEYLQNADIMAATYDACEKMLLGDVYCADEEKIAAAQLIEAMLHQAKHCAASPGLMDPHLPRFVSLLLRALADKAGDDAESKLQIWIIAALMDSFYYNAAATLRVMVESNAYPRFFDALFHFFSAAINSEIDAAPPQGTGKEKTAESRANDHGVAVLDALSILTRKVIALGLTALLHEAATQPSFDPYVEPTLALIEYCVFHNDALYTKRSRLAEKNITRVNQGSDADEEEEENLHDDDVVLGLDDDDDDDDEDDGDDADVLAGNDSEDDDEALHDDEGDDYTSPIDNVCEASMFIQWAASAQQLGNPVHLHMQRALRRSESEYQNAEAMALRYRQLVEELNRAIEEDYRKRSITVTSP